MVRQIHPDDLHSVWQEVREGLEVVRVKCGEPWLPEDVYSELKAGRSSLHMFPNGFMVLTPKREDYTNRPVLFIWIAYSKGGDYLDGEAYLDQLCKQYGFAGLKMKSPRRGWESRGWTPGNIEYFREVR